MTNRFKKISSIAWHPVNPGYAAVAYTSPLKSSHDENTICERTHVEDDIIQKSRKLVNENDIETIDSIFDIISAAKKPLKEHPTDEDSGSETDSVKEESDDENDDQSTKDIRDAGTLMIYKTPVTISKALSQESTSKTDQEPGEHTESDLRWASDMIKIGKDQEKSLPREDKLPDDSSDDTTSISSLESASSCSTMKSEQSVRIPAYEDTDGEDVDSIEDDLPITDTDSSVLLWNCDNDLTPQLELYNVHDVHVIKFYPLDGNFLAGGSRSGQLVIWDIRDDIETSKWPHKQLDQHNLDAEFMENLPHWEADQHKCPLVHPAAISVRNISHVDRVTDIEWMHPSVKLSSTGAITKTDSDSRQILTASLDGSMKVWELQSGRGTDDHKGDSRSWHLQLIYNMIITNPKLDKYPLSIVAFKILLPSPQYIPSSSKNFVFVPELNKKINLSIAVANTIGEVGIIKIVEKKDAFTDIPPAKAPENCKHEWWGICHDDVITSLSQNYYFPNIFLSTGGRIFALWNANFKHGPIWWKQYAVDIELTGSSFSPYHPGLIYISTSNGKVDIWNVTKQVHLPLLEIKASGYRINGVALVTPPSAEYKLSIADSNGIFHILKNQYEETWDDDDLKNVDVFFKGAEECKKQLLHWNKHWKDLSTTSDEYGFQYKPEPRKPDKYDPQRKKSLRMGKPSLPIEKLIASPIVDDRPLLEKIADSQEHKELLQKLLDDYKALPKLIPEAPDTSTKSQPLSINDIHRIYCT
ncbi:uncharacterized protein mmm isoform X2 [Planococcus citri]|uniref:uncharacterized protein mmm isoform X2 n=1 Tax=Planococcus citri TaxID=170843 RepID=UPI0031F8008A